MLPSLPRWIAHRGGGSLAPENTLAGIRLAARLGLRAVEFDVMLSADGTPVLIHDETLERTTNGRGRVAETADAVLFALDAGDGEPVPTFRAAASLCRELGLLANVEIKPAGGYERATAEAVAQVALSVWQGSARLPLLSSFSLEALAVARDRAPQLPRGLLYDQVPADWHAAFVELDARTLHCAAGQVDGQLLAAAAAHRVPLLCFTVNCPEQAKMLFAGGVAALFTDRLDLAVAETAAYNRLQPSA